MGAVGIARKGGNSRFGTINLVASSPQGQKNTELEFFAFAEIFMLRSTSAQTRCRGIGVSGYRRVGVSACRGIGVSGYRRVGEWACRRVGVSASGRVGE